MEETKLLREHLTALSEDNKQLKTKLAQMSKEKQAAEKKIAQQATRLIIVYNVKNPFSTVSFLLD